MKGDSDWDENLSWSKQHVKPDNKTISDAASVFP
jgi:hypothetical protein